MRIGLFFIPAVALLASCGDKSGNSVAPAPKVAAMPAPAGSDWTTTVAATPDGGFVMGNPNAPIKLVEYGSLTCPHCGEFSAKAAEPLKTNYVATGKVSYEYRNYIRDPIDVTAALLARCGGPGPFFPMVEQMYGDQANWFTKVQALGQAQYEAIGALPPAQQRAKFAEVTGLGDFVRQRGLADADARRCVADEKAANQLVQMQNRANTEFNLTGTPTFLINGQVVPDTATWEALEPALKRAGT